MKRKFYSIDRVEGGAVVLLRGRRVITADAALFDDPPREGQLVRHRRGRFFPAPDETVRSRAEANALLRDILDKPLSKASHKWRLPNEK